MIILGISIGVTSSAAIMINGKIIAAISEERFNRVKNFDGYPLYAIEESLSIAKITSDDIDVVAWGGVSGVSAEQYITNRYCNFKVKDLLKEQENYWKPLLYNDIKNDFFDFHDLFIMIYCHIN